jgi:hypothetical protein
MTAESGIDPVYEDQQLCGTNVFVASVPSLENLICMRSISKNSFIEAMNVRRDNIFEIITRELS